MKAAHAAAPQPGWQTGRAADWRDHAACQPGQLPADIQPRWFDTDAGIEALNPFGASRADQADRAAERRMRHRAALAVCADCPVRGPCGDAGRALRWGGVWGGQLLAEPGHK